MNTCASCSPRDATALRANKLANDIANAVLDAAVQKPFSDILMSRADEVYDAVKAGNWANAEVKLDMLESTLSTVEEKYGDSRFSELKADAQYLRLSIESMKNETDKNFSDRMMPEPDSSE